MSYIALNSQQLNHKTTEELKIQKADSWFTKVVQSLSYKADETANSTQM